MTRGTRRRFARLAHRPWLRPTGDTRGRDLEGGECCGVASMGAIISECRKVTGLGSSDLAINKVIESRNSECGVAWKKRQLGVIISETLV